MMRFALTLLCLLLLTPAGTGTIQSIETGKFRFYETKQIRGEENYSISRTPNGELLVQAKTDLPFAEQDKKPLVNATLRTSADFAPQHFEVKGPTLLEIEEDTSIEVHGKSADVQDRGSKS